MAGEPLSETLKQKTPLGESWYGESIADLLGAAEEAGEALIDPMLGGSTISAKIASKIPKGVKEAQAFQKVNKVNELSEEVKRIKE